MDLEAVVDRRVVGLEVVRRVELVDVVAAVVVVDASLAVDIEMLCVVALVVEVAGFLVVLAGADTKSSSFDV